MESMIDKNEILISVIIATYNRPELLVKALESLCVQSYPHFEVIIIDDGGEQNPEIILQKLWPFPCRLFRQNHLGCTRAKNTGASAATGEFLLFLDDDICVTPNFLEDMKKTFSPGKRIIAIGNLVHISADPKSIYGRLLSKKKDSIPDENVVAIRYVDLLAGLFMIKKTDFMELGMLKGVAGFWPNWEDVYLGYEANRAGFEFFSIRRAVGYHYDHVLESWRIGVNRWYAASKAAPRLFNELEGIEKDLAMFRDKLPIGSEDSFGLVLRKLARRVFSMKIFLLLLGKMTDIIENYYPKDIILIPLYRWLVGGYVYLGYRDGCKNTKDSYLEQNNITKN
jgi:glycosyltransferase involved in cell wall biosynthesis